MHLPTILTEKRLPIILVDIDGTIANCDHRLHLVRTKPKNYPAFFKGIPHDGVYEDVLTLVRALWLARNDIIFLSGRTEHTRKDTVEWLANKCNFGADCYKEIILKADNDSRQDFVYKIEVLEKLRAQGNDVLMAIEDRKRVVDAYRAASLRCIQVQAGDY